MQSILGLENSPPRLEKSIDSAKKLLDEIPADLEMESMSSECLLDDLDKVRITTRDIETNTDFESVDNLHDIRGLIKHYKRYNVRCKLVWQNSILWSSKLNGKKEKLKKYLGESTTMILNYANVKGQCCATCRNKGG